MFNLKVYTMKRQRFFEELGLKAFIALAVCMILLLNVQFVNAQSSTVHVKGVVNDVLGPVIGASVVEKGNTANGTITDIDGNFSLNVPSDATLVISFIGYATQEIPVAGKTSMAITLKEDTEVLDEVVVVGFGTQKKVNLTGSVGLATAKDLESRPVTNATQALQGLVPGLQISSSSGALDKTASINIRGNGTIGKGSSGSPLVLIDGMEGDLNLVNPQDIESVSVLKDAAASSIYGSRAPFGVILITTKKGKSGKATVNYNNSFRWGSPINMPEQMDSYTFANFFNEAARNADTQAIFTPDVMQKMIDWQAAGKTNRGGIVTDGKVWGKPEGDPYLTSCANTDWFSEIYRDNVFSQEHNVSISGGSEKISYYASLGYLDQGGLLRHGTDNMKRFNATAKVNAELTAWMKFNYSMRFVRQDMLRPTAFSAGSNGDGGLYENIGRQTWPNLSVYDENGYYFDNNGGGIPGQLALGGDRNWQSDRLYHQAALIFEPIKNWVTHVEFNYSTLDSDTREISLPVYNHDVNGNIIDTKGTSSLYQDYKKENYANWNIYSNYSLTLNDDHNFKVMVGFQSEEMRQRFFSAKGYGLQSEDLPELDLISGLDGGGKEKANELGGYRNEWATAGFFGRLNYDYQGRYMAEANFRYDGSSRFREGNRWQFSPSFSLGWNIAQESFWEDFADVCNQLKLRASYGQLGNMNTNDWYPTYRLMTLNMAGGKWLQNGVRPNAAYVGELISTALSWETVRTWNVGIDFGFLNNRLTGTFDVYTRFTDNMVGPAPELPATLGIATPKTNNCDLKTVGWELTLGWRDQTNFGLDYGVKFNLSDARTYVESYPGNPTNAIGNGNFIAGRELGEIWGFQTVGIAKTEEEMKNHIAQVGGQDQIGSKKWGAGDIMYADLDGKPGITRGAQTLDDHGDLTVIGNDTPRFLFGIDLNAAYKGFDIRALFQGVMKRDYFQNSDIFWGTTDSSWWSMGFKEHQDYFREEPVGLEGHEIPANINAYYPRPRFDSKQNHETQSRYLQDASYIRLKNLQVGYTLPRSIINKAGFQNLRVYVSGENLWTGTSLIKLFDPETISGGRGGNVYPLSRTVSVGLSVTL